ncbi:MAG: prepilin-type N-terminal cleavage/methylation domain-containing protein, partial [Armatimonadetes bacterium]|nr:prepilin-type N-terminal cleavage/methylation domain-containing protein [Armatimonadota bacterium]
MKRRGFTIIELLSVIAIIAILASILFPVFARVRERARKSGCASNLRQISVSLNLYAQEHGGRFPKKNNDFNGLYPYVKNTDVFFCPSDSAKDLAYQPIPGPYKPPFEVYSSYVIKGGLTNDDRRDIVIGGERLPEGLEENPEHTVF